MPADHRDRGRAESFGSDAERYDRTRSSYPDELFDELVGGGLRTVVDVGCGTGKVAVALRERGSEVLGVEVDERMAAFARSRGVPVEVAEFETWDAAGRTFDLLVSGTAWHWIDPDLGAAKCVEVVRPGGRIALFWNGPSYPSDVMAAISSAYAGAPEGLLGSALLLATGNEATYAARASAALERADRIDRVGVRSYPWTRTYTPELWAEELSTYSTHIALGDGLAPLLERLVRALRRVGPTFEASYRTLTVLADRSD